MVDPVKILALWLYWETQSPNWIEFNPSSTHDPVTWDAATLYTAPLQSLFVYFDKYM